jgi:hypothetical protein
MKYEVRKFDALEMRSILREKICFIRNEKRLKYSGINDRIKFVQSPYIEMEVEMDCFALRILWKIIEDCLYTDNILIR